MWVSKDHGYGYANVRDFKICKRPEFWSRLRSWDSATKLKLIAIYTCCELSSHKFQDKRWKDWPWIFLKTWSKWTNSILQGQSFSVVILRSPAPLKKVLSLCYMCNGCPKGSLSFNWLFIMPCSKDFHWAHQVRHLPRPTGWNSFYTLPMPF